MNKFFNTQIAVFTTLLLSGLTYATPPGGGGHGPGAADVPVDMHIYALIAVAVTLIIFFVKKSQKNII